jgi:8-oxo-dGTP diphosphatase
MAKPLKKYKFAVIASDIVIFTLEASRLKVLLIEMKKSPFEGHWAVPGGLVKADESVDHAVNRLLLTKAGIREIYMEQLYTFGRIDRDPFGRVVSVAYFALVTNSKIAVRTSPEYANIAWFDIKQLPKMAYDHREIVLTAVDRLKSKLKYTNIAYALLPDEFTFTELQNLYEVILCRKLDKRNFRKKFLSLKLIERLNKKRPTGRSRPALLYTFVQKRLQLVEIL